MKGTPEGLPFGGVMGTRWQKGNKPPRGETPIVSGPEDGSSGVRGKKLDP